MKTAYIFFVLAVYFLVCSDVTSGSMNAKNSKDGAENAFPISDQEILDRVYKYASVYLLSGKGASTQGDPENPDKTKGVSDFFKTVVRNIRIDILKEYPHAFDPKPKNSTSDAKPTTTPTATSKPTTAPKST